MQYSMAERKNERYTLGYGDSSMDWMTSRTADGHGSFLLPYLKSGMNLLDCGCGPGTLTVGYAEKIAPGSAKGLDRETGQTKPVTEFAEQNGISNLEFIEGDIYALPFPDNHFDAVFASAVLGSVANANEVVQEMVRVLKPAGVIAIKEFDHGSDIIWPQSPLIAQSTELYHRLRAHNNHEQNCGRRLKEFLTNNGCTVDYVNAYFDQQSDQPTLEKYIERNNGLFYEVLGPQYIELGWCTAVDINAQVDEWRKFAVNPAAIYLAAWLEIIGTKSAV
jgi:ubiquinone/menaquinone biosynthesis C-methylase UbiE